MALGWKFAHHPGIRTKEDKIVAWPSALGTKPTESQIEVIINDYKTFLSENPVLTKKDKIQLIENATSLQALKAALIKIISQGG